MPSHKKNRYKCNMSKKRSLLFLEESDFSPLLALSAELHDFKVLEAKMPIKLSL